MKEKNKRYIKPINYLYAVLILLGGIFLTLYIFEWYNIKKEEKLMNSYLITSNTIESYVEDIESLKQVIQEAPSSYFIYLGYKEDESVYKLEKELKRVIDKYKLNDEFYYVDITKMKKEDKDYLKDIAKELSLDSDLRAPAIIYMEGGKVVEVLDGVEDTMLKVADFEQLLDIYQFEQVK